MCVYRVAGRFLHILNGLFIPVVLLVCLKLSFVYFRALIAFYLFFWRGSDFYGGRRVSEQTDNNQHEKTNELTNG